MRLKLSTVHNVFFFFDWKKKHKQVSSITSVIFSFSLNNEENEDDIWKYVRKILKLEIQSHMPEAAFTFVSGNLNLQFMET